jgi:hypothetical protein
LKFLPRCSSSSSMAATFPHLQAHMMHEINLKEAHQQKQK